MTPGAGPLLDASLRRAGQLVAASAARAVALADLPAIVLPPTSDATVDQAQLRAVAVLYLASELEAAGIVGAAEGLASLARTGGLTVDLNGAARLVDDYWRTRLERASADERRALFAALFGTADTGGSPGERPNLEFEDRLIDLCEALYKIDEQASNASWGGVAQQARVRYTGRLLLDNLVRHASGSTVFFAQELVGSINGALGILNHPAVRAAFGARAVRDVVGAIARRLTRRAAADFDLRVRRGQAGMTILAWLADAAPFIGATSGQPLLAIDHPVIPAAVDWLETSLALTDAAGPSPHDAMPTGSPGPGIAAG